MKPKEPKGRRNPKSQPAAEQAIPAIAAEGLGPPAGDAPCKGVGETTRQRVETGGVHHRVWISSATFSSPVDQPRTTPAGSMSMNSSRQVGPSR